jgi:SAM-dependent methyltransferase
MVTECQEEAQRALWRRHSDAVNIALLTDWMPAGRVGRALKTDLFDEAVGEGLWQPLASRAETVAGIDISTLTLRAARRRHTRLLGAEADVRRLPLADGRFDVVVSNSTLDHFATRDEIFVSLRELHRVLRPGGHLVFSLDNLANPVLFLRNALPFPVLNRLGIVPYYVGATMGPLRLRRVMEEVGFGVLEVGAIMHCPRVLAVCVAGILERHATPDTQRRFLRLLMAFERLSRWPTRFLTGYFVAVRATKTETPGPRTNYQWIAASCPAGLESEAPSAQRVGQSGCV